MSNLKRAPYGTWDSPITADAIISGSVSIGEIIVDPITSTIYNIERRPSEKGRAVLVNTRTNKDVVGPDWNVRTGVQEYGGGAAIVRGGVAYFSNFSDGRVYRAKEGEVPQPVTQENKAHRFANFDVHPTNNSVLVSVLEDHTNDTPSTVETKICMIDTRSQTVSILVSGADFYAAPKFSPDGKHMSWQQWFHPDMPWEGAEIYVAEVQMADSGLKLSDQMHVAGKKREISVGYPSWFNADTLVFTSDESGFQNPWKFSLNGQKAVPIFSSPVPEDFAEPSWLLGFSPFTKIDAEGKSAIFSAARNGRSVVYAVDIESGGPPKLIDTPYVGITYVFQAVAGDSVFVFVGRKSDAPSSVVLCSLGSSSGLYSCDFTTLKSTRATSSASSQLPLEIISPPQPMTLKIPPNDEPLHIIFYAPRNPEYYGSSLEEELPPCVVSAHGGPTSVVGQELNWPKQYFTSRGWAWLDVNYGGSSGYGRKYTDRLVGKWGVVDVEDCILAVRTLSNMPYNLIDPSRTVIRGGSAGGYTTLAALSIATDLNVFAAGTSSYGISELKMLAEDSHKFESRYLEKLVGGAPSEIPEVYQARSPLHNADKIVVPLLILQGEIDAVVPKNQAEAMVKSIRDRGGDVEYKLYEGEGHGWRQEKNIKDALETEIKFYERVLQLRL